MVFNIKNLTIDSHQFATFDEFINFLDINGVVWSKLKGQDKQYFWFVMNDIKGFMIKNLKKFNMTWKDFKDYASLWYEEYRDNNGDDNKPIQQVILWKE